MLGWRKKPDGFEWHEYIRTTVLVRRKARRQKVVDARRAAGEQMQAAGVALAAGSVAAGSAAYQGTRAGLGALGIALQSGWSLLLHVLGSLMRPIVAAVSRPYIGGPMGLAGAIALGAGIGRWRGIGPDGEAVLTLIAGAVLMASLLPMLGQVIAWRPPRLPARVTAMLAGVAVLVAGAAWIGNGGSLDRLASAFARLPLIGAGKSVQGYGSVVGADSVRVGGITVRLAGIEAPEAEQRCGRGSRTWRCGSATEIALSRQVGGYRVSCTLSGTDEDGRALGRCTAGEKDVGAELVRQGHAFAEGGILARYAGEEREARNAKAGMWGGDVERPAEYRAKVWEEAKRRAPDGCPIKGQVSDSGRYYVLPWSPSYERARVQKARGERWFCSEQEAVSAGFKSAQRG
jgi:endonuclease YncB( thermonuclease family)